MNKGGYRYYRELKTNSSTWGNGPRIHQCELWHEVVPFLQRETIQSGSKLCDVFNVCFVCLLGHVCL